MKIDINNILKNSVIENNITISGWVRTKRCSTNICFIVINDGSTINNLQCVVDLKCINNNIIDQINTGTSVELKGNLVKSLGNVQNVELKVCEISILGQAIDFPIQPKNHSYEFLRDIAHLRFRTNTFNAVFRIRSHISFAIHEFFQKRNFIYLHTPIITNTDAEGAGELFTVTSLDITKQKNIDFNDDFFGNKTSLTVSGQLEAETGIFGLGKVYTFGPTFRAENSNTTRHLAEFWMVEPEMAFYNLHDDIELAEEFLKYIISSTLEICKNEIEFLDNKYQKEKNTSLKEKLNNVINNDFQKVTYTEAVEILKSSPENTTGKFKFKITDWGVDLQSEHEKYLTDIYFKKPVVVTDYPEEIKAFYMRMNDDNKTVAAMDILFPGIGEIIGGSQREERLDRILNVMKKRNMNIESINWYIDTRRFGSVIHSGFGLGLDRLVQFITGMDNIRDVIPFPRYPKHCEF